MCNRTHPTKAYALDSSCVIEPTLQERLAVGHATLRKRFGKADATRTQSVAYGLSFRAYAIALPDDLIVLQAKVQDMVTSIVLELFHYANNFTDRSKSFLL
ncbi:MAG: hypothetical protein F6K37_42930, partial [Moorea sp. SIO4E2]|uniref:hypothetical protein n=1 Tax=Moorena sp. SIO4E2 TaxID=2607826 RepID=UPI0013B927B3